MNNSVTEIENSVFDLLPIGIGVADMTGNLLYFNEAMLKPGGYMRKDIVKINNVAYLYFNAEIRQKVLTLAKAQGFVTEYEVEFKRKDGSAYPTLLSLRMIQYRQTPAWLAIVQDLTNRKALQLSQEANLDDLEKSKMAMLNLLEDLDTEKAQISRERKKDEALLASIGDAVVVTDEKGQITFVNRVFEDLIGWQLAEITGKPMTEIIPKYDEKNMLVPTQERFISKVLSGEMKVGNLSTLTNMYYYQCREGRRLPIVGIVTPIVLDSRIIGAVQVFSDATHDMEIAKMKDEFLNIAAHDLRTPSAAVRGFLSRVLDGDAGEITDKAKDLLRSAYEGNKRLIRLVDDFLMVSRIERGKITVEPKPGRLENAINKAVSETEGLAKENDLYLKYETITLPDVAIDEERIIELLINLIGNAIKFTSSGGITISHEVTPDAVITHVTDTGIGVSKDAQKQLFKKYFKVNSQEIAQSGLGLGLYISKLIMDGHGGKIWANSEEGKGATFSFSLSVAK